MRIGAIRSVVNAFLPGKLNLTIAIEAMTPIVVEIIAVSAPSMMEMRKARTIASFSHSATNQRRLTPFIGNMPNSAESKESSTTTAIGRNMKR